MNSERSLFERIIGFNLVEVNKALGIVNTFNDCSCRSGLYQRFVLQIVTIVRAFLTS